MTIILWIIILFIIFIIYLKILWKELLNWIELILSHWYNYKQMDLFLSELNFFQRAFAIAILNNNYPNFYKLLIRKWIIQQYSKK